MLKSEHYIEFELSAHKLVFSLVIHGVNEISFIREILTVNVAHRKHNFSLEHKTLMTLGRKSIMYSKRKTI